MLLDLTPAERMHLAVALRDRARDLRRDGRTLPPSLVALSDRLMRSAEATSGQNCADPTPTPDDQPGLLVACEAARLLRLSSRSLRRRAANGDIPSVWDGRRRRYSREAIDAYIATLPPGRR